MPTAKKEATIEELRVRIAAAKNLFFTNYAGLTVEEITKLRGRLRENEGDATYAVVKNRLFGIAAGTDLAKKVETYLNGPTGVIFAGEDPVSPAKALKAFSDDTKPVEVKAAWIDGRVVDAAQVQKLASLPPKIELLAQLLAAIESPLTGFVGLLSTVQSEFVRVIEALAEQRPQTAAPAAVPDASASAMPAAEPASATESPSPVAETSAPESPSPVAEAPATEPSSRVGEAVATDPAPAAETSAAEPSPAAE